MKIGENDDKCPIKKKFKNFQNSNSLKWLVAMSFEKIIIENLRTVTCSNRNDLWTVTWTRTRTVNDSKTVTPKLKWNDPKTKTETNILKILKWISTYKICASVGSRYNRMFTCLAGAGGYQSLEKHWKLQGAVFKIFKNKNLSIRNRFLESFCW